MILLHKINQDIHLKRNSIHGYPIHLTKILMKLFYAQEKIHHDSGSYHYFNRCFLQGYFPVFRNYLQWDYSSINLPKLAVFAVLFLGIAIFLFFYAHFAEKQDLLLKKPERRRIGFYFLSVVCIYGAILLSGILLMLILKSLGYSMNQQGDYLKNMAGILRAHPVLLLFTCATAGITEEIIFRGYLQQRIELILKSPVAGIVISSVIFGLAHSFYGTIQQVAIPFAIGIIFSIYYFKYKNIYVLMVFHFLFDYIQLLFLHIK